MVKIHKPRSGSLAYSPRKRAKKEIPRVKSWPELEEAKPMGFAGYKVGMTHVMAFDNNKNTPTSGLEISIPVTVIEVPPMRIGAIRAYKDGYFGKEAITEIWAKDLSPELLKKISISDKRNPEKEIKELEKDLENFSELRLIIYTQPKLISMPKKTPDLMEIAIGGSKEEQLEFAKNNLGKEINISDVFSENKHVDVVAVTKGKGLQGPIKRYGIKIQPRKAGKGRRHIGTGGAWSPARKLWREPLPGQMGYHARTEFNKLILKIGEDGEEVNPKGDFLRYGPVKNNYILIKGSVPGPTKRLIRFVHPRRPKEDQNYDIIYISKSSKQGV